MKWDQANAQCKAYGGTLASIHNREESIFLANYAASVAAELYVHIGLRADAARQWTWTDGTPYSFTNWAAGQPDNYLGAQYCGSLVTQSVGPYTAGQWDDYNCAGVTNAFCELDLKQ
ncbi:macrophage mannose receptor 1-like protein [Aphelenchoides avenae]|nr:macrophage mannose receptor 1-like protein [Aphelenchus avenae]